MKVEGQGQINPLERIAKNSKSRGSKGISGSQDVAANDEVQISGKAYTMQQLALVKEIIKDISNVRQDKVDTIKNAIQSGKYNVDAGAVAKKIIEFFG